MKDFVGKDVNIGDHIFYYTTGRWPEARLCEVIRFTPKSMVCKILKTNRPGGVPAEPVLVGNSFVKVDMNTG